MLGLMTSFTHARNLPCQPMPSNEGNLHWGQRVVAAFPSISDDQGKKQESQSVSITSHQAHRLGRKMDFTASTSSKDSLMTTLTINERSSTELNSTSLRMNAAKMVIDSDKGTSTYLIPERGSVDHYSCDIHMEGLVSIISITLAVAETAHCREASEEDVKRIRWTDPIKVKKDYKRILHKGTPNEAIKERTYLHLAGRSVSIYSFKHSHPTNTLLKVYTARTQKDEETSLPRTLLTIPNPISRKPARYFLIPGGLARLYHCKVEVKRDDFSVDHMTVSSELQ